MNHEDTSTLARRAGRNFGRRARVVAIAAMWGAALAGAGVAGASERANEEGTSPTAATRMASDALRPVHYTTIVPRRERTVGVAGPAEPSGTESVSEEAAWAAFLGLVFFTGATLCAFAERAARGASHD